MSNACCFPCLLQLKPADLATVLELQHFQAGQHTQQQEAAPAEAGGSIDAQLAQVWRQGLQGLHKQNRLPGKSGTCQLLQLLL
jgi:UDP-N-acetylenolpyruvoylglucosamine reductase